MRRRRPSSSRDARLARRVPGDERLNAVDCILPFFDRTTAVKVVRFLTGDLEAMPGGEKKAVIDGKELLPNSRAGVANTVRIHDLTSADRPPSPRRSCVPVGVLRATSRVSRSAPRVAVPRLV